MTRRLKMHHDLKQKPAITEQKTEKLNTKRIKKREGNGRIENAYVISSVLNVTMELMKFSRIMTARMDFQSDAFSPSSKQMDSNANLTMAGGLAIERTSTRCCFLIDFTAIEIFKLIG